MATQDYAASIQGVGVRVTRLDAFGNLLNGPGDSYTTAAFTRVSFTPEYEEGDEFNEKNAGGVVCAPYKSPDTLKRITMELAICNPDPELTAIASGGVLLRKEVSAGGAVMSSGWAAPAIGDDPSGNGVALEVWSRSIKDGKPTATDPYFHWVFPYVRMRLSGDRAIENGVLATTFEGFGLGNDSFGTGPDGRWLFPTLTSRPYLYSRNDWAPIGLNGLYTWSMARSVSITNLVGASDVFTFTTDAPHNFAPGEIVTISGVTEEAVVNGSFAIVSAPTATTFTASIPGGGTVSSEPVAAGLAAVPAGPQVVTTLPEGADGFNVPGNFAYTPAAQNDHIVLSNESTTP